MESFSVEPASRSAVFPHAREETSTWLSVDLRFVIAAVVVFGAVAAPSFDSATRCLTRWPMLVREGVSPFRLQALLKRLPGQVRKCCRGRR